MGFNGDSERAGAGVGRDGGWGGCDWIVGRVRYAEVARGVDGALTMLRRDYDQRGVERTGGLQRLNHVSDGEIDELNRAQQRGRRSTLRVEITAGYGWGECLLDQLLADAHGLEVHPEHGGHREPMLSHCASCR